MRLAKRHGFINEPKGTSRGPVGALAVGPSGEGPPWYFSGLSVGSQVRGE